MAGLGIASALGFTHSPAVTGLGNLLAAANIITPPPTPAELASQLAAAATAGNAATVSKLLGAGAPTESPHTATTPLIAAATGGHITIIEKLADHGAPLETPNHHGNTALSIALSLPSPSTAIALLDLGASPHVATTSGEPATVFATRCQKITLLHALLAHHSEQSPLPNLGDALTTAVANGDLTSTRILLAAGASPIPFETGGPNALDLAVRSNNTAIANLILAHHGTDLIATLAPDLLNTTVTNGNSELLESLLAHGASPDTNAGRPLPLPLDIAVGNGDLVAASHLLHHCSPTGDHLATAFGDGNMPLVDILLDNGADASTTTVDGEPPLLAAIRSGDQQLAARLLAAGADPSASGRENQSALSVAVALRRAQITTLLLGAGADPNKRLADPVSAGFMGLITGGDSLKYYLKRDRRFTPLMVAAGLADHSTIKTLLAGGASRGAYTRSWKRYPVSFAFASKDIYAQQLMLGRDPQREDPAGQRNVLISLSKQRASLFKNGKLIAETKISSGKKSTPTPKGEFVISDKHRHHTSSIYHVAMPYFQRLSGEAFGFHTGYVPSYPASHGCIRMPDSSARKFFSLTRVGDTVTIVD